MKHIQVIDGARNCSYDIFSVPDETFIVIFPNGQEIEFFEDFLARVGRNKAEELLSPVWKNRVCKKDVMGIHGTLFYELEYKKQFYPNKLESDLG